MTVLLVRSLAPSVSGWYPDDILSLILVSWCSFFQKRARNSLSRSDTISKGSPFSQYQLSKNISASFSAVRVEIVGIRRISEPRRSVRVRIMSKPLSLGSGPMKSIATESHRLLGTGSGCNGPMGLVVRDLLRWQSAQPGM